jgi:ABC-2 type transport system permease protein
MNATTGNTTQRVTLPRVVRSEWTKLWSTPSTAWSLLTSVALVVGIGVLYAMVRVSRPPADPSTFDPAGVSLSGIQLAQIAVGVLGVLFITGEFGSGLIRVSYAAVPRRTPVLWGKAIVLAAVSFVVCLPASFAAFLIGQSILRGGHLSTSFDQPGVPRAVLGGALYLVVVALIGLALGAILRSTAGAISALFGILYALQIASGFLPDSVSDQVYRYLPVPAGTAIANVHLDPLSLAPWTGYGLFCLYAVILLGVGAWRMRRQEV